MCEGERILPERSDMNGYRLKLTMCDVDVPVTRTVDVPHEASFQDLHLVIQSTFLWEDRHLYMFEFGNRMVAPHPFDNRVECAVFVPISEAVRKPIAYTYDFEDMWRVDVELLEEIEIDGACAELVDIEGICPYEGLGGPRELMEEIRDLENFDDLLMDRKISEISTINVMLKARTCRGIAPHDDYLLGGDDDRLAMIATLSRLYKEPVAVDIDHLYIFIVKKKPLRRSKQVTPEGIPILDPKVLESEPDRFVLISDGGMSFLKEVCDKVREDFPALPEVPNDDYYKMLESIKRAVDSMGLQLLFEDAVHWVASECIHRWSCEHNMFYMNNAFPLPENYKERMLWRGFTLTSM